MSYVEHCVKIGKSYGEDDTGFSLSVGSEREMLA